jgi:predicted ester cyclase
MSDQYATIMHRWFAEVWTKGRAEAIDEIADPGVINHGLADTSGKEVRGVEAFKAFHQSFRGAFPDIQVIVEDTVVEGDKIAARCLVRATHAGNDLGIEATGKPVEFTGMCMIRVKDGKIIESWNSFDFLTLMKQLEMVGPPADRAS